MNIKIGIVGLPNVGKSTLFKALTKKQVEAANYPFTTIEPNIGVVALPDERLEALAKLSKSVKVVPTIVEFVDIAGLVRGAHKGEGLGNKFLSHIREVAAVAEVVRVFEDPNVTHVHGKLDPADDILAVDTELSLADLETVSRRLELTARSAKSGAVEAVLEHQILLKLKAALNAGQAVRNVSLNAEEGPIVRQLSLLTSKPTMYVTNLSEEQYCDPIKRQTLVASLKLPPKAIAVPVSAKIESELVELEPPDRAAFLKELKLDHSGLDDIIKAAYQVLGLITFFTTGEKESRAWTVQKGARAPEAAGVIHSDFERGFIRAETVYWEDLIKAGGYVHARELAKVRSEGKTYVVKDGDVFDFKFNV
ncbi:MAG: redox-regulated ATPase YchF [Parcubacteria group bacterium]